VVVFIAGCPDQQLARPGGQLEFTGQGADLATVHRERRADAAGVDADPARQALQRHDDLLAVGPRDLDVERGRRVTGGGDLQRIATGQHQLALADSQVERRTGKIDAVGLHLGNGAHGDGHGGQQQAQHSQHGQARGHGDQPAPGRGAPRGWRPV
jgi:hypothetical protein